MTLEMTFMKLTRPMASFSKTMCSIGLCLTTLGLLSACNSSSPIENLKGAEIYPASGAMNVTPDTLLTLTFDETPQIGATGFIRVHDTQTGELVDEIDMSIAPSPLPEGRYPPKSVQKDRVALGRDSTMSDYQVNTIGGVDFHFHPIRVHDNTATIKLHNNRLKYDRDYEVTIDDGVLITPGQGFDGIDSSQDWQFSTRKNAPAVGTPRVVVSKDGESDFSTVQGAIDFAPDASDKPFEIFISNGDYEEIVMLKDKANIVLRGESRDGVTVHYPNNSAFNPPRKGPSRRPAFSIVNADEIQLSTFTIENDFIGQAEALLAKGQRIIIDRMTLNGSGDALTTGGSIYMVDSELRGDGDTILAYATLFCQRCTIKSVGPFVWPRTPEGQHGNVFIDSRFEYLDVPLPWTVTDANPAGAKTSGVLARLPQNGPAGKSYSNFPHAEMVLIDSVLDGIPPEGWGPIEDAATFNWDTVRLMEFNSIDVDGKSISLDGRHAIVRKLNGQQDKDLIEKYRDPEFVFDGWKPQIQD